MVHDLTDRKHVLRLYDTANTVALRRLHPKLTELRKVLGHGIIKIQLALFNKHGNRNTAKTLGLGALHVDIVKPDRTLLLNISISNASGARVITMLFAISALDFILS